MKEFKKYQDIQKKAKEVLTEIGLLITVSSTEKTIVNDCIKLLKTKGITETWYHNAPAFVLLGSRSCLSISGYDYTPSDEPVGNSNLITIDISPLVGETWGYCARSYVFLDGKIITKSLPDEFNSGIQVEKTLHTELKKYVTTDTTFEELCLYMNSKIKELGFVNLDFMGNLGHSINKDKDDRIYIEKGNTNKLSSINYFTFEPHVRAIDGRWGFKHENIYYFDKNGCVCEL